MNHPGIAGPDRVDERIFFDANPTPMFIFAEDDLSLLAVNEAMVTKYGWSREELLRMSAADLRPPDELPRLMEAIGEQRGSRVTSGGEWPHIRKDGTRFDVEVTISCLEYRGRAARLVMATDVSPRKQAEAALRQSEEQLRLFVRFAPALIAMFDRDMRYVAASRRWKERHGISGDITGRRHYDLSPDLPQRWKDLHHRALSGEILHSDGEPFESADGTVQWVRWEMLPWRTPDDEIGGILVATEDITERKTSEDELRRSELRFRGTFENAAVGMAHVAPDGTWLRVNSKLCEIVGYTRDELLHRSFADITHPDDLQNDWHNARRALDGEIDSYSSEKRYIHKDGTIRWISLSVSLVRTPEGRPDYFISVMRDIGERKKALRKLADSERRFRAMTEKAAEDVILMDAMGEILYESPNEKTLLGYARGTMTGSNGFELIHPDDRPQADTVFRELVQQPGASRQGELRMLRPDGSPDWVHFYATNLLADPAVGAIVLNLHNITQRKAAEEALRATEHRLAAVVANLTEGIITGDSEGRLTSWNPAALEMFGYANEQDCPRRTTEFSDTFEVRSFEDDLLLPPDRLPIARILRGEVLRNLLLRVHRKDQGWEKIISYSGTLVRNVDGVDLPFISTTDVTDAKQAEAAVRASEAHLRQVIDNMLSFVAVLEPDGSVRDLNAPSQAVAGLTREDAVGRKLWDCPCWSYDLTVSKRIEESIHHAASGDNIRFDVTGRIAGGDLLEVDFVIAPVPDESGKTSYLIASGVDITERRHAEQELRASEERYRKLVSVITDIPWTADPDGRFVSPQEAWAAYTGQSWQQHRDFGWADALHPDDRETVRTLWRHACETKSIYESEGRLWHAPSQEYRHFVARAVPILGSRDEVREWVGSCTDVHEKNLAESRLRDRKAMLSTLTSHSSIGMVMITRDHRYAFANAAYHRIHQLPDFDIVGRRVAEVQPKIYQTQIAPRLERAFSGERVIDEIRLPPVRSDGPDRWFTVTVNPPVDTIHGPCAIVMLADISARKQAEEQIRRINEELEARVSDRTSKLAAANRELEAFSYSVSHDLRAPLRALDGFSQILLLDYADSVDEQGRDYLRRIRAASQRMGELIDALLRLARITRSEIHTEQVDMSGLAHSVAAELKASDPERAVEWVIEPDLSIQGEPKLLRLLLENLLGNAWKYTSKNPTARIEFGTCVEDGVPSWFVRDDGAGFDNSQADRLFAPFQRLHKSTDFKGIGIGLATVRRIVARHGGTIRAEGEPGRGATFHFTLAPVPFPDAASHI